jgi:Flp pilus assembly protein TadG
VIATASATGPGRHRGRGFLADENAATAVEFALVAAPFLALIVGIIRRFWLYLPRNCWKRWWPNPAVKF